MNKILHSVTVVFLIALLAQVLPVRSQDLSDADMIDYLTQSLCVDINGLPTAALPISDNCPHFRPQRWDDNATYRKHDWPNSLTSPEMVKGYQASDSVLLHLGSRTMIVQTFDFGTGGRVFGRFDGGPGGGGGDGGQVLMLVDGWTSAVMTEDGGGGVQWFIGEACRSQLTDRRFLSWLMFRNVLSHDTWTSVVAHLNIATNPLTCPRQFNAAFTRYRLDQVTFPFRVIDDGFPVKTAARRLDVVVSEHYGGSDIETADHLERFFFARKLGLVRWERWSNQRISQRQDIAESAAQLARTARCPRLENYVSPDRDWQLVDCRTWTALVRQTTPWSVSRYDWTALKRFDRLD